MRLKKLCATLPCKKLLDVSGGADLAELVNARPTSLGLLLKMAAIVRDQPDKVKADFLASLRPLQPLYMAALEYMMAYR